MVLHYTGMATGEAALRRLCDPEARVSAHYLIEEDGGVAALVPEDKRAWHAGRSCWRGRSGLNDVSIGVEIVNPGHEWGYRPFPEAQILALVGLARGIMARWAIPAWGVVAHSDVAPDRKADPGEFFPWRRLAGEGIGIWPEEASPEPADPDLAAARLAAIGYPTPGLDPACVLTAFQRRFRPDRVDGRLDDATMGRLGAVERLLRRLGAVT